MSSFSQREQLLFIELRQPLEEREIEATPGNRGQT